ncbi:MAG: nitroreductase family deazaflavin-dependent oxidoreductase, partial [Thaumarchaeota archaeon]|nr:nitroreductase family deazaflavin-dependent oxidoreductase [Nitrososphaerota archaeon]
LYLTTTGWKSGRPHEIEIWFVGHGGKFYLVSEHERGSHWMQNIRRQPLISFRVGQSKYKGKGREVDREKEADLAQVVSALMNERFGWSSGLIVELAPNQ